MCDNDLACWMHYQQIFLAAVALKPSQTWQDGLSKLRSTAFSALGQKPGTAARHINFRLSH